MGLITYRNNALDINGRPGLERELTENVSNWLWAVTAVFGLCFVLVYVHTFMAKNGEKIFHYLNTFTLLVGLVAYYAMASGLGFDVVDQANEVDRGNPRQMFWVKYVYWLASFANVSVFAGLISNVSWATIVWWVVLAWTWVISYLISAYIPTNYKWGFFGIGTAAYFVLAISVFLDGIKGAKRVDTTKYFILLVGWIQLLWLVYPLGFGLTDGSNFFGTTPMFIWFGVLDVLMVPVLSIATIILSKSWDYGKMNLYFTQYGRVQQGGTLPEKDAPAQSAPQDA